MAADPAPLAAEIRRRLGPPPELAECPLVSIVVLNRDGAAMLRRLLAGLIEHTDYPHFELILVDNASSDNSLEMIDSVETPFPIATIANSHNESFSDGCNQGAALANGELLLFLNNDIEPFEDGWLRELVACMEPSGWAVGAVASTLICPEDEHERSFAHGYGVQHRGLEFRDEDGWTHPVLRGWEADPLDERLGQDVEPPAVAAACLLVHRGEFNRVHGFTSGYMYGVEDVDLCLKLQRGGLDVLCSGRSIVIHHPVSTRRTVPFEAARERKLANLRYLWERWGPDLSRHRSMSRSAFVSWLQHNIASRAPVAVVRIGDGELHLLEGTVDNPDSLKVAAQPVARQLGRSLPVEDLLKIQGTVKYAYEKADLLGILPHDSFTEASKPWLGRLMALHDRRVASGNPPALLCRANLHHEIFGELPRILEGVRVSVISCRDVKTILEDVWQLQDVVVYPIPSQVNLRGLDGPYETALHHIPIWPDAYERLLSELTVRERGEVFLVGAGLFGKGLCVHIRELGGIALDVGSVLDHLVGMATRDPLRWILQHHADGMPAACIAGAITDRVGLRIPERLIMEFIETAVPYFERSANWPPERPSLANQTRQDTAAREWPHT